ncbi:glycosyltransferase [Curtobacterium sp. RRHDQ10]|uniref:glycosyltransferase n=1 Tax=Curtobacterium phyllosphaerae TaxID=3413379 RepID=UPI003BF0A2B0
MTVVQPYLPQYRVPLFERVAEQLRAHGHTLTIVTGTPHGEQLLRADSATMTEQKPSRHEHSYGFGPVHVRSVTTRADLRNADALVVELAAGSLDTVRALLPPRRVPVAVWGHVGDYVVPGSALGRAVKRWQVRTADRVFAYTPAGAQQAIRWGAASTAVDTMHNTVDLSTLSAAVHEIEQIDPGEVRRRLGSPERPTFAFIGGIDSAKRVDILVGALEILHDQGEDTHLLVAGDGSDIDLFAPAAARGQVTLLGRADDDCKALMARVSLALLNPGRVGLIAPESFVLGLPVITTTGARHAPEFDYLDVGRDSDVVDGDAAAFAAAIHRLVHDSARTASMQRAALHKAGHPSLDAMAETFVGGVLALLDTRPSAPPR